MTQTKKEQRKANTVTLAEKDLLARRESSESQWQAENYVQNVTDDIEVLYRVKDT